MILNSIDIIVYMANINARNSLIYGIVIKVREERILFSQMGREDIVKFMRKEASAEHTAISMIHGKVAGKTLDAMKNFLWKKSTQAREKLIPKKFRKSELDQLTVDAKGHLEILRMNSLMNKFRASKSGRANTTANTGTTPKIRLAAIGNIRFLKKILANILETTGLKVLGVNKTLAPTLLKPIDKVKIIGPTFFHIKTKNQTMVMRTSGRRTIFREINMTDNMGVNIITLSAKVEVKAIEEHADILDRDRLIGGEIKVVVSKSKKYGRNITMRVLLTDHAREELVATGTDTFETMTTRNGYENRNAIAGKVASDILVDILKSDTKTTLVDKVMRERSADRPTEGIFTAIHETEAIGVMFLYKLRIDDYRGIEAHFRRI